MASPHDLKILLNMKLYIVRVQQQESQLQMIRETVLTRTVSRSSLYAKQFLASNATWLEKRNARNLSREWMTAT